MDIEQRVLLLAILKKDQDETLNDILIKLSNSKLFTLKEGKKIVKDLKNNNFICDGGLTIQGEIEAKSAEQEFKI